MWPSWASTSRLTTRCSASWDRSTSRLSTPAQPPEGMKYFDFVMSEVHGLRIKELVDAKQAGRKVVGAFCTFVPEEIVLALDGILVGLCAGAEFATAEAEKLLPRNTCALIKGAFGFALARVCPYLSASDVVVGENTCDGKKKSYEIFKRPRARLYVMDLPQMKSAEGRALLRAEFKRFGRDLEGSRAELTADGSGRGIATVNAKRAAMHRLAGCARGPGADLRARRAAREPGLLLRRPGPLHRVGERDLRRARAAHRARRGRGAEGRAADPRLGLPHGGAELEAARHRRAGRRGHRRRGVVRGRARHAAADRGHGATRWTSSSTPSSTATSRSTAPSSRPTRVAVEHVPPWRRAPAGPRRDPLRPAVLLALPDRGRAGRAAAGEGGVPTLRIDTDYGQEDVGQIQTRVEAFVERLRG
jgi:hypothetical protein